MNNYGQINILKRCGRCEKELPLNNFHEDRNTKDGKNHYCKKCRSEIAKSFRVKNKNKFKKRTKPMVFAEPILKHLIKMGGKGSSRIVLKELKGKMELTNDDKELSSRPGKRKGVPFWHRAAHQAVRALRDKGYIRKIFKRGVWELTERGKQRANGLIEEKQNNKIEKNIKSNSKLEDALEFVFTMKNEYGDEAASTFLLGFLPNIKAEEIHQAFIELLMAEWRTK